MNEEMTSFERLVAFREILGRLAPEKWQNNGDTYPGMKWNEFKERVESFGFVKGYLQGFATVRTNNSYNESLSDEEILWHKGGIIVYAKSVGGTEVDRAIVYGEFKHVRNYFDHWKMLALEDVQYKSNSNGTWPFSFDAEQGLKVHLDLIDFLFTISKKWTKPQKLDLINYADVEYNVIYSEEQIINAKLKSSSPEIQEIVFGNRL